MPVSGASVSQSIATVSIVAGEIFDLRGQIHEGRPRVRVGFEKELRKASGVAADVDEVREALQFVEALDRRAVGVVGVEVVERKPRLLRLFREVGQMRIDRLPAFVKGGKPRRTSFEERVERLFETRVVRAVRKEEVHARHFVENEKVSHAGGFERPVFAAREHARTDENVGHHVDRVGREPERFGPVVRRLRGLLLNDSRKKARLQGGRDGFEQKGREGDFLRFVERFQKVRHVRVP